MSEVIFSVEHTDEGEYVMRFKPKALEVAPPPVREHLKGMGREMLFTARRILDAAIAATEEKPKERTEVEVE
jgi:hypothetical protein